MRQGGLLTTIPRLPGIRLYLRDLNNITSENTRETNYQQNNYKKTFRTPQLPRIYDNNRKYFNPPKIVLIPSLASFSEYELYRFSKRSTCISAALATESLSQ